MKCTKSLPSVHKYLLGMTRIILLFKRVVLTTFCDETLMAGATSSYHITIIQLEARS